MYLPHLLACFLPHPLVRIHARSLAYPFICLFALRLQTSQVLIALFPEGVGIGDKPSGFLLTAYVKTASPNEILLHSHITPASPPLLAPSGARLLVPTPFMLIPNSFTASFVSTGEGELLFPPLSHLEVVGEPRLKEHAGQRVVVVRVKININQKSLTIEEMLRQRKRTVVAVGEGLAKEMRSKSHPIDPRATSVLHVVACPFTRPFM